MSSKLFREEHLGMAGEMHQGKNSEKLTVESCTDEVPTIVGSFFNDFTFPEETEFQAFKHDKQDDYKIHGQNDRLVYDGESAEDDGDDYYVGIFDPKRKTLDLRKANVVLGKVTPKSMRGFKGPAIRQIGVRNTAQRMALGETFGTKKAKAAINNMERNRVDADKLENLELDIVDSVKEKTRQLPTKQEVEKEATEDRIIPIPNVDSTNVEDIYPVNNIIPEKYWTQIRVAPLTSETDPAKRLQLLPYSESAYVNKRLSLLIEQGNSDKLKLLYYASLLFGVYANRRVRDRQTMMLKLHNRPSDTLMDAIVENFTVLSSIQRGKSRDRFFVIDPQREDKILCYLMALIFNIDNYVIELPPLAHELNVKPTKLTSLCRALGAIVKPATVGQAEAFGIPKISASSYKVASLKVPFKLPEISRRGRKGGR